LPLLLAAQLLGACATAPFTVSINHAGRFDPAKDAAAEARAKALPWDGQYAVDLYLNSVPEGLELEGTTLKVRPGQQDRYTILGTVKSEHETSAIGATARGAFWYETMHEQHSRARDIFCKVQTPLRTLTLGAWWLLSPTSWPCWVTYPLDSKSNLELHAQELRRAAAAMGANMVVVAGVHDDWEVAGNGWGVQSYTVQAASVSGFAVVDRGVSPGAAEPTAALKARAR
jgi:hypothetical protein